MRVESARFITLVNALLCFNNGHLRVRLQSHGFGRSLQSGIREGFDGKNFLIFIFALKKVKISAMKNMAFGAFLLFIIAVHAYSACEGEEAPSRYPMRMIFNKDSDNNSQVYKCLGGARMQVQYICKNAECCEFVVQDLNNTDRKLSIQMDTGLSVDDRQSTKVVYQEAEALVTSCKVNDLGILNIGCPAHEPTVWSLRVSSCNKRPLTYGTIEADEKGAAVTRYIFQTPHDEKGAFVCVSVQYAALNEITFSWGTEFYGGSITHSEEASELAGKSSVLLRKGSKIKRMAVKRAR